MKSIGELPEIQREILRKIILDNPKRPSGESFSSIYRMINYEKFNEDAAQSALEELVAAEYLIKENGTYSFSRDSFFQVKKHYKWLILLNDTNTFPMLAIAIGVLASIIASSQLFTPITKYFRAKPTTQIAQNSVVPSDSVMDINDRLKKLEDILLEKINLTQSKSGIPTKGIEIRIATLEKSLAEYNEAFSSNPIKTMQLSALRSDLDNLKTEYRSGQQSLAREIDRISSYNTTIIIFMITFMIGFLGLGIINYFKRKDD